MNIMKTFLKICRPTKIIVGLLAITYATYSGTTFFYMGVVPLMIGIMNICPICLMTKKCDIVK